MINAEDLIDLFDNCEYIVEHGETPVPGMLIIHGDDVKRFLAYTLLRVAIEDGDIPEDEDEDDGDELQKGAARLLYQDKWGPIKTGDCY
jgi:hypothetical protein